MGTKSVVGIAACCLFFVGSAIAQSQSSPDTNPASLDAALYRSVCERVQAPVVFSTRDTLFALSLPTDEPAEVYLQLTVGKNGKVKEKETRVHANHIAGYVAPAFIEATKELKVDKGLLAGLQGKDTSVLLTFPLEYQCALDTIMKVWPEGDLADHIAIPFHYLSYRQGNPYPATAKERERKLNTKLSYPMKLKAEYLNSDPTRVWYYLAVIKGQPE